MVLLCLVASVNPHLIVGLSFSRSFFGFLNPALVYFSSVIWQIFQHLRYQTVKDEQVWIVRILFIVPIYGLCSWLGLVIPDSSVYFDAVRGCYEGEARC